MKLPLGIDLFPYQEAAVNRLGTGSILCGGVGSGKSLKALAYYYIKEYNNGEKKLYIITTANKRDTLDWEQEYNKFLLEKELLTVDSWNNIKKYEKVKGCFFIFDEQRVVGSGAWVKSFLKIVKENNWILLSATPGDTWMDYIPAFIANKFYKNRTEFLRMHVIYNTFTKYPKVDHYVEERKLIRLKNEILVNMEYLKKTVSHHINSVANFDKELFDLAAKKRWNPFSNKPIKDVSEYCHIMRKIVNSDSSRLDIIKELISKHRKIIVFYNFDYELDILRSLKDSGFILSEYNGHKHEEIPESESWIYLVQYLSGAEGWNCIKTNVVVFYSQNYSYRIMTQAAGRIDRLNTPFGNLYYYHIKSNSLIDLAIEKALSNKKDFNENKFVKFKIS